MTKKHIGTCCICGREGKLTFEHIPPHKASNGFPLKLYNVGKYITEIMLVILLFKMVQGHGHFAAHVTI